jgi:hypothetical protein
MGMHRSGTTSLAGCLQEAGLELGKVRESSPFNPKGNRENLNIRSLNDDVLTYSNGSWSEPPDHIRWTRAHADRRRTIIEGYEGIQQWGFKDPRTILTLPFWLEAISTIHFVGTFRHPIAVARSLEFRNGFGIERSLELWCAYNKRLLDLHKTKPFPLVAFDLPTDEYRAAVRGVIAELGLQAETDGPHFFEPQLRHQFAHGKEELPSEVLSIWHKLQAASKADTLSLL